MNAGTGEGRGMGNAIARFFATGADREQIADAGEIGRLFRRHRVRVMLAITLGYGLIYTCRLALGVVKKPVIDAGVFSPNDLGVIVSALLYTYAIGMLTNGFIADHANLKRFLALAILMTALCDLASGFAHTLGPVVVVWVIGIESY